MCSSWCDWEKERWGVEYLLSFYESTTIALLRIRVFKQFFIFPKPKKKEKFPSKVCFLVQYTNLFLNMENRTDEKKKNIEKR